MQDVLPRARELLRHVDGRSPHLFDAIVTNPPWSCWGEIWRACWPHVDPVGGLLAFLGPSTWGHSDEDSEHVAVFDECPPACQLRVRGRIAFNGGAATDNRKCSAWVWTAGDDRTIPGWVTTNLPALPVEARRWRSRPGTT